MSRKLRRAIVTLLAMSLALVIPPSLAHAASPDPVVKFGRTAIDFIGQPTGNTPGGGTYSYDATTNTITFEAITATSTVLLEDINVVFKGQNKISTTASWGLKFTHKVGGKYLIKGVGGATLEIAKAKQMVTLTNKARFSSDAQSGEVEIKDLPITMHESTAGSWDTAKGLYVYQYPYTGLNTIPVFKVVLSGSTKLDIDLTKATSKKAQGIEVSKLASLVFNNDGDSVIKATTPIEANYPEGNDIPGKFADYPDELEFKGCGAVRVMSQTAANADPYSSINYTMHYPENVSQAREPKLAADVEFVLVKKNAHDQSVYDPDREIEFGNYRKDADNHDLFGYHTKGNVKDAATDVIFQPKINFTLTPPSATLAPGESITFTASTDNSRCAVEKMTWALSQEDPYKPTSADTKVVVDPTDSFKATVTRGKDEKTKTLRLVLRPDTGETGLVTNSYSNVEEPEPVKYNVTFDSNGGDTNPPTQTVLEGSAALKPSPDPKKDGYRFEGWFLKDATEAYNFATPVKSDLALTAQWKKLHQVTFDPKGGTGNGLDGQLVADGETVVKPDNPTKQGYVFKTWLDSVTKKVWDFLNDTVTAPTKLEAIYEEDPANPPAPGGDPVANEDPKYNLVIGDNSYNVLTDPKQDVPGGSYSYDKDTNTVTLSGLATHYLGVTDMNIAFSGENTVNAGADNHNTAVEITNNALTNHTITGIENGGLTVLGGDKGLYYLNKTNLPTRLDINDLNFARKDEAPLGDTDARGMQFDSTGARVDVVFGGDTNININMRAKAQIGRNSGIAPGFNVRTVFNTNLGTTTNIVAAKPLAIDTYEKSGVFDDLTFSGCGVMNLRSVDPADAKLKRNAILFMNPLQEEKRRPNYVWNNPDALAKTTAVALDSEGNETSWNANNMEYGVFANPVHTGYYWTEGDTKVPARALRVKPVPEINLTVTPQDVSAAVKGQVQFTADRKVTCDLDDSVVWSVLGATSADTKIDQNGLLTIGADENAQALTVTATSVANDAVSASSKVTLREPGEFTVTFDTDGGVPATIAPITVAENDKVTAPADPTKAGHVFIYWSVVGSKAPYDFNAAVTSDVALIAQWLPVEQPVQPEDPKQPIVVDPVKPKLPNTGVSLDIPAWAVPVLALF